MEEQAKKLVTEFVVADAEYPSLSLADDILLVDFTDWREQRVRVRFENCAGVKWQEIELSGPQARDDTVYEILHSNWLTGYFDQGARTKADELRHFRLCFNACGTLDVLAAKMTRAEI